MEAQKVISEFIEFIEFVGRAGMSYKIAVGYFDSWFLHTPRKTGTHELTRIPTNKKTDYQLRTTNN